MRTWPTHGRPANAGAWRDWPLRRIVSRTRAGSVTVIETLECGHAQYQKAPIRIHPGTVGSRRCRQCKEGAP